MSLKITRAGIHDTVQDTGRKGFQHLGVNPGGAMDRYAAAIANSLVNNDSREAVIEMHFPAAEILFKETHVISITGANFTPTINEYAFPLCQPVIVPKGSALKFTGYKSGAWCYLAIHGGLQCAEWLGSRSANVKLKSNEIFARLLSAGDILSAHQTLIKKESSEALQLLPWWTNEHWQDPFPEICILPGPQWDWLDESSKEQIASASYQLASGSDRMGNFLSGPEMNATPDTELLSFPVNKGAIQLLPNGQLVVLMADHQTTGGYPVIGYVVAAHLDKLAQKNRSDTFRFKLTDIETSEEILTQQQKHLLQLSTACKLKFENYFH